ncbi:MAG: hypothetical protein J4F48_14735 [Nitrospinae bacterium]|nr:hypothetical protein [Nitrospinota bacterium]
MSTAKRGQVQARGLGGEIDEPHSEHAHEEAHRLGALEAYVDLVKQEPHDPDVEHMVPGEFLEEIQGRLSDAPHEIKPHTSSSRGGLFARRIQAFPEWRAKYPELVDAGTTRIIRNSRIFRNLPHFLKIFN